MKLRKIQIMGITSAIVATIIMTLSFGLNGFLISAATAVATVAMCQTCKKG
jgi:hypothetical protein